MPYNATEEIEYLKENVNHFFLLANAIFVSFMQAGFACLEAGAVRTKNATNIIMKNLLDLFICCIAYYLVGYALAYGDGNPFVGYTYWAGTGLPDASLSRWFFQFVFAATAATILSGAVAERCNFIAYIVYSALISGVVYPIVSRWVWDDNGWLNTFGYKDFAGCGAVHALAGVCAFCGAAFLGPRKGRFDENGKPQDIAGHSLPLVGVGALLLMSGFLAFNGGSLGHIAEKGDGIIVAKSMFITVVGGSGGVVICLLLGRMGFLSDVPWPFSVTLNGTLAGMVSICGSPDTYSAWAAFFIGAVGALVFLGLRRLVLAVKVDDPLEATAVHLGAGCWGVIARPLFAADGLVYQATYDAGMGLYQNVVGLCAIIAWSAACSIVIFGGLKLSGFLRVSAEEELEGLDVTKHGEHAYPPSAWRESGLWSTNLMSEPIVLDGTYKISKKDYDNHAFQGERKAHNVRLFASPTIDFSLEVRKAMEAGHPLVALESTSITHWVPYPRNLETALSVESMVRDQGAVPATIAIIGGRIKIGLERRELEFLSKPEANPVKTSRRDFPYVLSHNLNGGTTVSGTLMIANHVGIKVFVTGGVGGVHKHGESTLDVSADLVEMGRQPLMVVSSGIKSVLDIERTLEYLETQGVCVISYGPSKHFPAFYCEKSGFMAPYHVTAPDEAAAVLLKSDQLGFGSGILLAVPVPKPFSIEQEIIDTSINLALEEAENAGVPEKDISPFVQERIGQITAGKSLESNIALIKNNALIGGQVAVAYQKLLQTQKK